MTCGACLFSLYMFEIPKKIVSSPVYLECLLFQKQMMSVCEADMARGALVTVGGELASCGPCLQCCRGCCCCLDPVGGASPGEDPRSVPCLIWKQYGIPYEAVTDDVTFLTTRRVNMCETARICTSDPFLAPAASPSFSTFPSPQTPMFLQKHSQLFWGFLMGKTCKAKCFPFATFVKFVCADQVI